MKDAKQEALGEPHPNGTNVIIHTVRFDRISNLTSSLHFFDMVMLDQHERALREARREERTALLSDLAACRGALERFGRHHPQCASRTHNFPPDGGTQGPCNCGFDAALSRCAP